MSDINIKGTAVLIPAEGKLSKLVMPGLSAKSVVLTGPAGYSVTLPSDVFPFVENGDKVFVTISVVRVAELPTELPVQPMLNQGQPRKDN